MPGKGREGNSLGMGGTMLSIQDIVAERYFSQIKKDRRSARLIIFDKCRKLQMKVWEEGAQVTN